MAFVNEVENRRTIDHERGFVLESKGGASEDAVNRRVFELSLNEIKIKIETLFKAQKGEEGKMTIFWSVVRFTSPQTDCFSEEEVFSIIRESLEEYTIFYDKSRAERVIVNRV